MIEEFDIAKLRLAPGDVLVVRCKYPLTTDTVRRVHSHVTAFLPPDVRTMIIPQEVELSVLTKADIDVMTTGDIITQRFRARDS
jgi:hypothetical protein